ncbi:hypothetical protein [Agrobacterium tumefaciens]|uniref:hypothetical protein n=1 Tax=Agrobacterium tumefaciens TaxID=358 RepID=UPI00023A5B84|nr:hypothetical protein AT5A_09025 [Agrobacterium tumefaciens 5A]
MADIHERLTAREELEASFESLKAQGIQASLDYIQVNVAPQIANLQTSIDLAQTQIDQIIIGGKAPDTLKFGGQLPAYYATTQALSQGLAEKVPNTLKVNGKALSSDVTLAKADIGLANVDNTADADKPISMDQEAAFAKRVRVDAGQVLTDAEKGQARANAGVGVLAGHRNKIINGGFPIWQRGPGPFTTSGYTADRWRLEPGAGSANSVQRADFVADDNLPFVDRYTLAWTRSVSGSAPSYLLHKIEGARTLAGKLCTLTIWARASVATKIRANLQQRFGTGGSPSGIENYPGASEFVFTGGGALQRFDLVFTLGKLASKTFGSNFDDALWVLFEWLHTDPNATIAISRVSLCEGDVRTENDPFGARQDAEEQRLCDRFYQLHSGTFFAFSASGTATVRRYQLPFRAPVRAVPNVGWNSGDAFFLDERNQHMARWFTDPASTGPERALANIVIDAEL